jgi:hypothetical protein
MAADGCGTLGLVQWRDRTRMIADSMQIVEAVLPCAPSSQSSLA